MREWPVNLAAPGWPVGDVSVSSLSITRTSSTYTPGSTTTVPPAGAASIVPWSAVVGCGSITYACGLHQGVAYMVPSALSTAMPMGWSLSDVSAMMAPVSESCATMRGSEKSRTTE